MSEPLGRIEGMKAFDESETPRYRERLTTLVDGLVDRRRQIAKLQAEEAELLRDAQCLALERMDEPSAFPDRPGDIPLRSIAAEIGAAAAVGLISLLTALLTLVFTWPTRRRRERTADQRSAFESTRLRWAREEDAQLR